MQRLLQWSKRQVVRAMNTERMPRKLAVIYIGMLMLAIVVFIAIMFAGKASAQWTCSFSQRGINTINGNTYRTIYASISYTGTVKGGEVVANCTFAGGELGYQGRTADSVWLGHSAGDGSGYRASVSRQCATIAPSSAVSYVSQCTASNGDYSVMQDDASLIQFPSRGVLVHCSGYGGICGTDIYANGVEPPRTPLSTVRESNSAYRGAGFWNYGTQNYTHVFNRSGQNLTNTPIRIQMKNTWSPGYSSHVAFTFRYPAPVTTTCTPSNSTIYTNTSQTFRVGGNSTGTASWSASGANISSGSGTSFTTSWPSAGSSRQVRVTRGGQTAYCYVNVESPPANSYRCAVELRNNFSNLS